MLEGCSPECLGRLLEGVGNGVRRWMVASPPRVTVADDKTRRIGCPIQPTFSRARAVSAVQDWRMDEIHVKADLQRYLQSGRDALLWKLSGLNDYDARRPVVSTGTNLLGLVKHVAGVEIGYFGDCFARPFPNPPAWLDEDAEDNADMWATAGESLQDTVELYQRVWAHSDATIAALPLDAAGHVPWWSDRRNPVTLYQILIHEIAETHRHAGHADLARELIDGSAGLVAGNENLPFTQAATWAEHRDRLENVARGFLDGSA